MSPYFEFAVNNRYANRTLYEAIAGMDQATFTARRPGFFPSLSRTLNHIRKVDAFYLGALKGTDIGRAVYALPDIENVIALAEEQSTMDMDLMKFCEGDIDLDRCMTVKRPGVQTRERIGALLPHLFQHQIHHRGQAHVQVGEAGIAPPQLDDFFLEWERAPIAQDCVREFLS
ncbi:MAG: nuclease [Boseongicola sp. SB0664_bin_43]|uniref:Nuclease n=1 Tax=Boseongicola sp. SB0664_bin_43 TaxID=2604844 RepID=A0A6B0XWZ3_9RHOB|nr:nuclease [Boseongicola sp. SB0664_bin_43]MYK31315.1 nuclease [Boseongicola sp. SB0670_bin_30]